jgi:phosphoglycolate phosphatase
VLVEKILKALELEKYFNTIVAGDDLLTKKPDPTPLITCAERLGVPLDETVFVGDSTVDQKTAIAANIKFFFFRGGYDDGVDQSTAIVFDNHLDIFKLVKHGK